MSKFSIAPLVILAAFAPSAWAIHLEPDQQDLKNPKTQLVEATRAAESMVSGGTTSISSSSFTGFNDAVKRKPFPPGYGRSGYQFEDELTATTPQAAEQTDGKPSDQSAAPSETRKP